MQVIWGPAKKERKKTRKVNMPAHAHGRSGSTIHAGKPLQRLRGSKHGPLFGGGDEVDAYGGFFSLH